MRVCDNSLQYARALASLEEIRHGQTELAVAASGGSLMARIARLLGRPAVDDRRFTWLPGLITLLLVIGVVIPAAFALAHPTPDVAEPTADNAAAPTEDIRDATDPNTPPQVYIAVRLVLTEVFCDTVLDPQTAAEATELLTRLVPSDADNPSSPPTAEELQRPLADVFSKFAPAPGQSRQFIDLLASRKRYVASNLSAPQVTVLSGESLSFTLGNVASPDTSQSQDSEPPLVRCSVTATKTENQNTIRMDIDLLREYPVYRPDDPNSETAAWAINTTILVPNDQWTAIAGNMAKRTDESGRECLQLPLVLATIVPDSEARDMDTPGTVPMIPSADGTIHLPPGMGGLRPTNPAGPTQVLTRFLLFSETLPDKVVDRETRNLLAGVLTREDSQALREIIHADPQRDVTLSDVFRTWIGRNPLPPETMEILIDVLQSRGYLPGETTPEVLADLNRQGRMNLITERLRLSQADPASAPEQVKLGVFVQVTPHIPPSGDNLVRLEVAAQWKERAEPSDANEMPAIRTTEIVSTLAIPDGQCAALVAMNAGESNAGFHLLVVGPPTVIRPMTSPAPIISPPSGAVTADEPARTQVLLSFTIVDVLADRVLDPDAAVQARNLLMRIAPGNAGASSASTTPPPIEQLQRPLRDVFARFAPVPEKSKELTDLLISRGYAQVLSRPRILTFADEPASVSLGEPDEPNAANGYLRLTANAHVLEDQDATRLEIDYVDRRAMGGSNDPDRPVSSTQIASTLVVPNDQYAAVVGMSTGTPGDYIRILLIGPTKVIRPQRAAGRTSNTEAQAKADKPASMATDGPLAQTEQRGNHPRQVLLDTRVIAMERDDLRNLGVEWGFPASQPGQTPDDGNWLKGITIGYLPDQPSTDSLMMKLSQLDAAGRAYVVAAPQQSTQDGRQVQLQPFWDYWANQDAQTAADISRGREEYGEALSGVSLSIVPHVGDDNEITLEVEAEISKSHPQNKGVPDLPILTRRRANSKATIRDGGTIALAGLVENSGRRNGPSTKDVAIFVTAHLVPETGVTHRIAQTISPLLQLAADNVFYGRVLFRDGTPALLQPAPWPGARTRIALMMKGRSTEVAQVDDEGYFVLRLEDTQRESLSTHRESARLFIDLPTDRQYPWEGVAVFPFEKLAKTKQDAGTITVRRTLPTIMLPNELREGGPLPDGWRLEYQRTPATGRIQEILFNAEVVDSHLGLKVGEVTGDEEFVIYDPNGKEVERFRCQSMMAMYKTVRYTLIGRKGEGRNANDWRIVHGPYILDMTRSGWYKLTIDLGATSETDPQGKDPNNVTTDIRR